METYLARFDKMVAALRKDSRLTVCAYHRFPPADEGTIEEVENVLGAGLHATIKSFYRQSNGLQLLWLFKGNDQYGDAELLHPHGIDFLRQSEDYHPEDGAVMIPPIQEVFLHAKPPEPTTDHSLHFMGKDYPAPAFAAKLRSFDRFSKTAAMVFFLNGTDNPPVVLGDDHQTCHTDSRVTDFESYMEFVLANKGVVSRRRGFYHASEGHRESALRTPLAYWTKGNVLDLDVLLLKDVFPLSDKAGSSTAALNTPLMQQIALSSTPLRAAELRKMVEAHHQFLASGGAGGRWQTVHVSGLVLGIYTGGRHSAGEQAAFDRKHLSEKLDMVGIPLPFANFCACHARRVDFSDADLSHCLFTDSMLEEAVFADAKLSATDFSRAFLKGASFMNADLSGADFENCDLTNADFRGANLEGSRFPGAVLKGVRY